MSIRFIYCHFRCTGNVAVIDGENGVRDQSSKVRHSCCIHYRANTLWKYMNLTSTSQNELPVKYQGRLGHLVHY